MNQKKKNGKNFLALLWLPLVLLIINGCSTAPQMQSSWMDKEFKIDGKDTEWRTGLLPVPEKKINIGFKNDDDFLYICLTTDDRATIQQIVKTGFIVWFEPESGKVKQFGIKYPLERMPPDQFDMTRKNPGGLNRQTPGERPAVESTDKFIVEELQKQIEFEIIDKNKKPITAIPVINREGINLKIGMQKGFLTYELQLPLKASDIYSFAVGAEPGEKINIKFETEEPDPGDMRIREGGMSFGGEKPDGGDMPAEGENRGGSGMSRKGGGGMRSGGGMKKVETLDYSVELILTPRAFEPKK